MNTTRNIAIAGLVIIIGVAGFYLYKSIPGQGAAVATSQKIHIGFIAPITGPFATWGESIQHGAELAAEDTRHAILIEYQDDACDPKQAVSAAQKFFAEHIHAVLGPGCDDSLKAIMPLAKQNDAVVFSTGLLGDDVFVANPTNLINLATQVSTESEVMAAYLQSLGIKTIAVVHGDNSLGQEFGKRLPEKLAARGESTVLDENTSLADTDFRTTATKTAQLKPDAIFIHQGEQQIGLFAKQFRTIAKATLLFGMYGTESQNVLEAGGVAVEGMRYTYPLNSADGSAQQSAFNKRYTERFGTTPTATSAFIYDGIMLLDKAFDVCAATDGACIEKFLKNYGPYEGLSGKMEIQSDGKNIRPFGIKEVKNGQFVWVTKEVKL